MIEFRGVSAGYGGAPILSGVSFIIPDGKLTVIIGPNGCGKTTLLRTAARQLPVLCGSVLVDGRDISDFDRREFARSVAFMPQTRSIPDITVYALACHGRFPHLGLSRRMTAADRIAVDAALEEAGASAVRDKRLRDISGGERQLAYLAMALAQESGVLLLDEPAAYLDAPHQFSLLKLLRELSRSGRAVAVVMHDLAQAMQYGDSAVLLAGGRLAAAGAPEELFSAGVCGETFGVDLLRTPQGAYYVQPRQDMP
jgi:ABC-type cobalamin/Fe3+-siderophores transport system ATPase subunit